ncbi:MAG: riboflavin synthase [Flavitalea sp.]
MFTGIIESLGTVESIQPNGSGRTFWISAPIAPELKEDQSLSHNGACLTVEEIKNGHYRVTAIEETLLKTNLSEWQPGDKVNLERCILMNGRLDGHIVQGHVDTTATCISRTDKGGSWEYGFGFPAEFAPFIIEKGSICVNGISLTVFDVDVKTFWVAIIPYTYTHTNVKSVEVGNMVNVEFDVIGKYIQRFNSLNL